MWLDLSGNLSTDILGLFVIFLPGVVFVCLFIMLLLKQNMFLGVSSVVRSNTR